MYPLQRFSEVPDQLGFAILSVTPENPLLWPFLTLNLNLGITKMSVTSENPLFPNPVLPETSVQVHSLQKANIIRWRTPALAMGFFAPVGAPGFKPNAANCAEVALRMKPGFAEMTKAKSWPLRITTFTRLYARPMNPINSWMWLAILIHAPVRCISCTVNIA